MSAATTHVPTPWRLASDMKALVKTAKLAHTHPPLADGQPTTAAAQPGPGGPHTMHGTFEPTSSADLLEEGDPRRAGQLARWEAERPARPARLTIPARLRWWLALYRHEGKRPESVTEALHRISAP